MLCGAWSPAIDVGKLPPYGGKSAGFGVRNMGLNPVLLFNSFLSLGKSFNFWASCFFAKMGTIPTQKMMREWSVRQPCTLGLNTWELCIHVSSKSLQEEDMKDLALLLFLTFFEFGDLVSQSFLYEIQHVHVWDLFLEVGGPWKASWRQEESDLFSTVHSPPGSQKVPERNYSLSTE